MRQARVALVTPLRDGMNVVAKEFVAAQDASNPGMLVLSRFAGAADQLSDALLVNPNDPDTITEALDTALRMDLHARQARWTKLWGAIKDRSARLWGDSFLSALTDVRTDVAASDAATQDASAPERPAPPPGVDSPARVVHMLSRPATSAIIHHNFGQYGNDRTH
jgi:trehalose 6-phosphate synthase